MVLMPLISKAQDPFLSQFNMAPTFLSPSLAGSTGGSRFVANYRNQWPGIEQAYKTYAASVDMYLSPIKSGIGFVVTNDVQGSANLSTLNLGLQYSFRVKLNRRWQFVPGLQFTYGQRKIDLDKLTYATDIEAHTTNGMSYLYFDESSVSYLDFATSAFFFSKELWLGVNVDHLMNPNTSFLGDDLGKIPVKATLFGACNIWKDRSFAEKNPKRASFAFRYQRQNKVSQLDMGMYMYVSSIDFGAWYRGIPLFNNEPNDNRKVENSAVVLSVGLSKGGFHIGYAFDVPITNMTMNGRGAHEVYMVIEMASFFGFGDDCLSCLARRKGIRFNWEMPRNMKMY
jgi:type IX secretion system PorP/SprF family membrane protein